MDPKVSHEVGKVPYTFKDNQWVGYDDEVSLQIKMDWMGRYGYVGTMFSAVDLNDFHNWYGRGPHSMLQVIYDNT
jgi:chitinase